METLNLILLSTWDVLTDMAPFVLFGFLLAGVLALVLTPAWMERHLGGRGIWPVIKASFFGVPLPLCSCGVIPVATALRKHGASRGATASFLISTPQTGVDSIALAYALLGPVFAFFRAVSAFLMGLLGGILTDLTEPDTPDVADKPTCTDACCAPTATHPPNRLSFILHYGFVVLPRDIAGAMLLGILAAGAISALVPSDALGTVLGGGIASMLLMMVVGIPLYICSTASIPFAYALIQAGASPGAALVFLITGPATNAATITTMGKVLGRRTLLIYLGTVMLGALGCGLFLDELLIALKAEESIHLHGHGLFPLWTRHLSAAVLLALLLYAAGRQAVQRIRKTHATTPATNTPSMRITLQVGGMTCDHCANSVHDALLAMSGIHQVDVQREAGIVVVEGDDLQPETLCAMLSDKGFPAIMKTE